MSETFNIINVLVFLAKTFEKVYKMLQYGVRVTIKILQVFVNI